MNQITIRIQEYLEGQQLRYQLEPSDDQPRFRLGFRLDNGQCILKIQASERSDAVLIHTTYPFNVPENQIQRIATLLVYVNWGLLLGNMEMDPRDGELRFRVSIPVEDSDVTMQQIKRMVGVSLAMVDRYFTAVTGTIFGNGDPVELVRKCEEDQG